MNIEMLKGDENCENKICRICLSLTEFLLPIFEGEGLEQELELKIQKYLPVKITAADSLPQQLCYHCANALISWDNLVTICLESDRKLRFLVEQSNRKERDENEMNSNENDGNESGKSEIEAEVCITTPETSGNDKVLAEGGPRPKRHLPRRLKRKLVADKGDADDEEGDRGVEANGDETLSSPKVAAPEIKTDVNGQASKDGDAGERVPVGRNGLNCEYCGKSYKGKRYLARHIKLAHKQSKSMEAQKCDLCSNVYKTKANLERHYAKEHVINQVECPVCHASVHSKKLESHLKTAHGVKAESENEERFKCKFCEKWFKNKYVRNAHVKEIHLSEPIKCKLCDFQGVRTVLRRHKTEVHAEKRFPCSLCNAAFKTLHTLKMHMTSHSDLRSFTCDICGMGFKRLNNVRDHMKCHEQKSNQCQICGNFFARKRYLAIHEKTIHNFYADGVIPEEKGFECGICGAKLKWKKNLLAHMRIHTGEKPYVCKICKKDFVCHGSLRTHMSKHGVCAAKESNNILSSTTEVAHEQQPNHPAGVGLFTHFSL